MRCGTLSSATGSGFVTSGSGAGTTSAGGSGAGAGLLDSAVSIISSFFGSSAFLGCSLGSSLTTGFTAGNS